MTNQIEAVNGLLSAVRKFVVLTRGAINAPERFDLRVLPERPATGLGWLTAERN